MILNIQGWFYILLDTLLLKNMILNTLTKYKEYYEELGFRIDKTVDSNGIKMIYEKKNQCENVI